MERVLDGPIPYRCILLHGDGDLEHGLRHYGVKPETTSYRLVELCVRSITDTRSMPHRRSDRGLVDAVLAGIKLPPLVVFRHPPPEGGGPLHGGKPTKAVVEVWVLNAPAYQL